MLVAIALSDRASLYPLVGLWCSKPISYSITITRQVQRRGGIGWSSTSTRLKLRQSITVGEMPSVAHLFVSRNFVRMFDKKALGATQHRRDKVFVFIKMIAVLIEWLPNYVKQKQKAALAVAGCRTHPELHFDALLASKYLQVLFILRLYFRRLYHGFDSGR